MPPEHCTKDRPSYYTMKTPGPVSSASYRGHPHSRSNSQTCSGTKKTASPTSSPRPPHPPKQSPDAAHGTGAGAGAQDAKSTSPNYFGLAVDPTTDPRDSCQVPRENWSSPSSSVKSFAAVIPNQMPLDANPEFEAFRRQVDANRSKAAFNLTTSHFTLTTGGVYAPSASTPSVLQRPRPPRWHTQGAEGPDFPFPRPARPASGLSGLEDAMGNKNDRDAVALQEDSAYVSADSKRSSSVSLNPPFPASLGRHSVSPPKPQSPFAPPARDGAGVAVFKPDSRPSPQLSTRSSSGSPSPTSGQGPGPFAAPHLPGAAGASMISPAELSELMEKDSEGTDVLLIDIRVSPQFAQSRIRGALNLCIPTTLLKRATFNLQKLQQTFHADRDQEKFADWRNASHLVVYDAASSDPRDALPALNMIKKFTNEGYSGVASILRGGFHAFAAAHPSLVDSSSGGSSPGLSLGAGSVSGGGLRANLPPVFGGVVLPNANDNPTPFFNNIRQNQDLVDGVGQMEIGVPSGLARDGLPRWLRDAAEAGDHGKKVSDKFLHIELTEQSRMREAYSMVSSSVPGKAAGGRAEATSRVQLSGIEQGVKNRYKDILPFEHARVKLLGRPDGTSDYVNASHLRAHRTHKRYIASQGPLPATFEDFWSVVWDNDVRVIVMLTAESEGGQLKCHPYWKGRDFGPIRLRELSEKKVSLEIDRHRSPLNAAAGSSTSSSSTQSSTTDPLSHEGSRRRANTTTTLGLGAQMPNQFNFGSQGGGGSAETPHVIIRKFALSHAAHPFLPMREITQLHFPSWPDFGAPAQPSHLLALVELANVMQRAAFPSDAPGTLGGSPSASRHNGDATSDGATNASLGQRGAGRGSSAADLKRADSDSMVSSWADGPEPSEHARPMLVHCSAGCGRTGAFCTVDSVIDMLKRQRQHVLGRSGRGSVHQSPLSTSERDADGDIDMAEGSGGADGSSPAIDTTWLDDDGIDLIAQTVEDFRGQRLSMVQSLRQFVLCYETVLEWIKRLQDSPGAGIDVKGRGRSGSLAF